MVLGKLRAALAKTRAVLAAGLGRLFAFGRKLVIAAPLDDTLAEVGISNPVTRLMVVLLPAPLGPMTPSVSPQRTSRSTPSTAATPPKWRLSALTCSAAKSTTARLLRRRAAGKARAHQTP